MTISTANEVAKLPPVQQKEIAEQNPEYASSDTEGNSTAAVKSPNGTNGSVKAKTPSLENPITEGKSEKQQNFLDNSLSEKSVPTKPLSENPTTATYNKGISKKSL